ncbi:40-residue YVTN family beta-propeller repeat-containing protein [Lutibacter oricola]|uniref:40-residue YVTN family beta-propeller repeat-containing protein n=1 Tax=Lutibacter oricola TaxID=762486 RepID=A0A1H2YQR1_9FLAO|nr:cytochrome D1 domain-containing protein [Lutibacter oricola]SDX07516.1 40-residue YVTN family beta-propeller repeat-containing protein [Lutibacter oricola]
MKHLKHILISLVAIFLLLTLFILIFRLPSYTIKTSGKLYIVNKISRSITVFDLFKGKQIAEVPINMESHEAITTIDKSKVIVTNYGTINKDGNLIKVINTKTNEIEKTINLKQNIRTNGIANLSETNKIALIDYANNNLLVLNTKTDSIEKQIQTKQKFSHLSVIHPTKPLAYVTNMKSNSVSVIDLNKNKVIKIIPCGLTAESIDITPNGSEIWVTNKNGNSITIINTSTYKVIETLNTGNEPLKVKFSIDGNYCLIANASDGTISIYNQLSKKQIKTINIPGKNKFLERILYHTPRPVNIFMHPNGLYAFIANSNADKIEVLDMKTFTIVSTIGTGRVPDALTFVE